MADIELVIKIPEGLKNDFESEQWTALSCMEMKNALENGTPLPKGHGRLIDVKELRQDIIAHKYSIDFCKEHNIDQSINVGMLNILLADAPTIIEADKAESEGQNEASD